MSDHVDVDSGLALPFIFRETERQLRLFDPKLRLRKSVDNPGFYVLERRTTRTKPPDSDANGLTDTKVATRDGYLIVSHVHPLLMQDPDEILARLRREGDMHAPGMNPENRLREIVNAQQDAKARRRRARLDNFRAYFREWYDVLDRVGDRGSHAERMRMNNAGGVEKFNVTDRRTVRLEDIADSLSPKTSAGESPAKESSDVHPPGTTVSAESGQLHDRSLH